MEGISLEKKTIDLNVENKWEQKINRKETGKEKKNDGHEEEAEDGYYVRKSVGAHDS